jgi:RNase P/RNase MRP subunit p30
MPPTAQLKQYFIKSRYMFDIIRCRAEATSFGFSKFFFYDDVKTKIVEAENLEAAVQYKNRKTLIMLRDHAFDEGAIRLIAEKKNACFLIDLGRLMRMQGVPRAVALSKLRNFLRICIKYNAFYAFASFAGKEEEIRNSDELINIALLFDLNRGQAKFALEMLGEYLN